MSVTGTDWKFRKSEVVTDTTANGGRKGQTQILNGMHNGLFPLVTQANRTAGITRHRKIFVCNENAADDVANYVRAHWFFPSIADDRFAFAKGTDDDTAADIANYLFTGCGQLETALSGGETSISLTMESDDAEFEPGGWLWLSNKYKAAQTIDSAVRVGDSVQWSTDKWVFIAATTDITYPKGRYCGDSVVLTEESGSFTEQLIQMATGNHTDDIGDGDGSTTNPTLTDLTIGDGIVTRDGYLPTVTATCGGVERTVNVASDGACTGYCSAGELNLTTGVWVTDIDWTTAPDNATDIEIAWYEKNYTYSGDVVTITLADSVADSYATANTYASGCVYAATVEPSFDGWTETSTSGTYDESTYPMALNNDGAEEDSWTITFTSASAFTCAGLAEGSVGTGDITTDFSPTNPNTGQPYFTLDKDGWGGSWTSGDTVEFDTHPSALPVWVREIVPAGAAAEERNFWAIGVYNE